jgi:hypothetical protein
VVKRRHCTWRGAIADPVRAGDLPVGTIQRDEKKGTLYAGTDFGVVRRVGPNTGWRSAMPDCR